MKRGRNLDTKDIADHSLTQERNEKIRLHLSLYIFLISFITLTVLLSVGFFQLSGKATSLPGYGGQITGVDITMKTPTYIWVGTYGIALRVSGFTQVLSNSFYAGTIARTDTFFDCIKSDAEGGPEIFASTSPTLDFSDVRPGTTSMIDSLTGCNDSLYCASGTFTRNMSFILGSTNISGVPATFTHKYDGNNTLFDIGILNISGQLAFVSHIIPIQRGFDPNVIVNYQMMLPAPENTSQRYYFFSDPNDVCPSGGIGYSINSTIYGYVFNELGEKVANATVTVGGYSTISNEQGFYNLSTLLLEGSYSFVGQKVNYSTYVSNISINESYYVIEKNFTLTKLPNFGSGSFLEVFIYGYTKDSNSNIVDGVNVSFGNNTGVSNSSGYYGFNTSVPYGYNHIVGIRQNYDNYVAFIYIDQSESINHNITMVTSSDATFVTGPFTSTSSRRGVGPGQTDIIEEAKKNGEDYWVSTKEINKQVRTNTFVEEKVSIFNLKSGEMKVYFTISSELMEIVKLDTSALNIGSNSAGDLTLTIYGIKPVGLYTGYLNISGDINQEIPINIEIVDKRNPFETLLIDIDLFNKVVGPGSDLRYKLLLENLLIPHQSYKVYFKHKVTNIEKNIIYSQFEDETEIENSITLLESMKLPSNMSDGDYLLEVEANYLGQFSKVSVPFRVAKPLYLYAFFGIPLWLYLLVLAALSFLIFNFFIYKRHLDKKKRYHLEVNIDTLPKKGNRSIKIGKLAETNIPAYYDLDMLTTHAIIAGATGGGKSISAQVLIEEALMKNIAVIVFDPTAQWSGMLRKCDDKKMLSLYPNFGLKPTDAKSFPGSVRQIKNSRQTVDIRKHMNPGQIQVFTLNKLDPSEMDVFVAGVIASIFRSGPEEYPGLRLLLVFDEVHRLLPKFGGSGKGFLQIERACREFRKWGFGVMLVSQVLSDFVGEIKANINTEMQMRVAEENDLQRIRERYGEDALRSLVRSEVGTGMIQNAEYNRGRPFFVAFRPILHNTRRLTDEILDKYNGYNEVIDDLEYQIEQIEELKVDAFDLKMELKLVKDKLMTGNFSVVDIYLEGLKPRLEKQWQKLGKKPKKKVAELLDVSEIEKSLAEAKKGRTDWEKSSKKEETKSEEVKEEDKSRDESKIVKPITFDNGMMVSSLKELQDVLPTLDEDVFSVHVTEEKNDIADWISKNIDKELGSQVKKAKDKQSIIKILSDAKAKNAESKKKSP